MIIYANARISNRQFPDASCRDEKLQKGNYKDPVRLSQHFNKSVARPAGFEPATTRLEGACSIQLSYGRAASAP